MLQIIQAQIARDGFAVVSLTAPIFTSRLGGTLTNAPNATMINQLKLLLETLHNSDITPVLISDINDLGNSWIPGKNDFFDYG